MICENCEFNENGMCIAVGSGEHEAFPVSPEEECVFERIAEEEGPSECDCMEDLDSEEFFGEVQNKEKLKICKHIIRTADAITRTAPHYIHGEAGDMEDNTARNWQLCLDLHSPTVFISMNMRKRLCELMLASDEVSVAAENKGSTVRYTFVVKDLWS